MLYRLLALKFVTQMLVSHTKKFIFMKTSKTAGTSVEVYFEPFCLPEGEWKFSHYRDETITDYGIIGYRGMNASEVSPKFFNHISAGKLRDYVGVELWQEYFKFTVIRNPFDRLVSAFFHFHKHRNAAQYNAATGSDPEIFRSWIDARMFGRDHGAYLIDGKVAVDYFIRYENLNDGLQFVCDKIGAPFNIARLPRLKSEYRDRTLKTKDFYDKTSEALVREAFKFEFDYFNYEMP